MKLAFWTWLSIGLAIAIIAASIGYFRFYEPNMVTANATKSVADQWETEARKLKPAEKKRRDADAIVKERAEAWQKVVVTRTPSTSLDAGGVDLSVSAYQLVVDSRQYRNSIQTAVNRQVKTGGVTVLQGPEIPLPDDNAAGILANYYNYGPVPFPVVIFDLGAVTVRGTYEQIKANVEAWSTMPNYLAVADGLRLEGTSPNLTGTYNLSIVGFIRSDQVSPNTVDGGAAAAPAGGLGFGAPGRGAPPIAPPNRGGPQAGPGGRPSGPPIPGPGGLQGGGGR